MKPCWPSSRSAVSILSYQRHATFKVAHIYRPIQIHTRHYAQAKQKRASRPSPPLPVTATPRTEYSSRAALDAIESRATSDPVNPPRSVNPPPLDLPSRGSENFFLYLFRLGRAYGGFYKDGIKAVWFNYRAAKALRERIRTELEAQDAIQAAQKRLISRAEWQLLLRNDHDIAKLPLFGLLVAVLGEWLPLLVPFIPSVVPGTARIPSQVKAMRAAGEERRRASFRQGIAEPSQEQLPLSEAKGGDSWPMTEAAVVGKTLGRLSGDQLQHLSTTLGLHSRLWDRVQLPPPVFLLKRSLTRALQSLSLDDLLLAQHKDVGRLLSPEELELACEARGLSILGKDAQELQSSLT